MSAGLAAQPHDVKRPSTVAAPSGTVHLDLDGARHIFRMHEWKWTAQRDPLFETGLEHALEIFEEEQIQATLFVIAEDLADPLKRELIRAAVRCGHDIASHTVTHRPLSSLSRAEKRREIFESRERIADVLGVVPRGFRAPAFSIDRDCLLLLEEAGYDWDSSVLPGRAVEGTSAGRYTQPRPALEGGALMELPLPSYRPLPLPFHPSYSLVLGNWYFDLGLRRFRAEQAPLVLLFHLTDFADALTPDFARTLNERVFTLSHLSNDRKRQASQRMIQAAKKSFTLGTTDQLLARVQSQERPTS